jgi:putative exosortase-associated protein (TIGR04073 family)
LSALLLAACLGASERALADTYVKTFVLPEDRDWAVKVSHKFSRGVVNVATSPLEIPKKSYIESSRSDQWMETFGRLFSGTFIGLGRTVARTGAGVFDLITFPLPINDYDPILEPEYVF